MIDMLSENSSNEFLQNLIKGNRSACSTIVRQQLITNPSIKDLYEELLRKSLYEIGKLWETNKISVATEHVATAIVESILNEQFEQLISAKRFNKKVIVACIEKEQHLVGIKMVADVFEMNGWESFFLGNGIPNNELIRYVFEIKPDILALSLSIYFNYSSLLHLLDLLREEFPDLMIILGGQALQQSTQQDFNNYSNLLLFTDLYVLEQFIKSLNNNH